jgi:GAF domain-containing protein
VALRNTSFRLGDAAADPGGRQIGASRGAESMLLVPMSYESRVLGVIVPSRAGYDQYTEDDQRTLEIFAGYAAQAMVNGEAFGQVRRQQHELRHRLESQRRLLEVTERLFSTLDPSGVLEMIADPLQSVVSCDSLTIYRIDRARSIRRAVVARDRFAELILSHGDRSTWGSPGGRSARSRRCWPTTPTSILGSSRFRAHVRNRSR